ncbi:hypothetical protein OCF84_21220 (plasmid) [Shewanella xiamenensis]|uniref:Uncharacterized protein n=1 Tax=Shewanella xiamenensis TaxID=332186 RepID=A0ABT6UF81_9GAMM|nr:hypothetical protein [Shewanella xiamenensis]MDI5832602.1 hypothetical protein [Shewanella xiamenensis]WHF57780.1 hypothetical protein OCF84_21220 [Shewanella xiamenensis]
MSAEQHDSLLLMPLKIFNSIGQAVTRFINSFVSDKRSVLLERIHAISLEIAQCNELLTDAISQTKCTDAQRSKIVELSTGGLELNTQISEIFSKIQLETLDPIDYDNAAILLDKADDWCEQIKKLFY